ncbi:MAG: glycosyltransferase [Gallionellaceae bacterium]|nr:glycosyltransferase [Gallionellaceae bacterium]
MIFVTVGTHTPFDRLVKTVDQWALASGRNDIFAQVGLADYRPANMQWTQFLSTEEYQQQYAAADVIVAHAGTGSIITALQLGKPILIMPRQASLRETRNDHQIATAEHFRRFESVTVARDEQELIIRLAEIDTLQGCPAIESHASHELMGAIRDYLRTNS